MSPLVIALLVGVQAPDAPTTPPPTPTTVETTTVETTPATATTTTAVAPAPSVVRIAVRDVEGVGVDERLRRLFAASLVGELRKLQGVSVVSMAEVRVALDQDAQAQLVGCDDGCPHLADLTKTLGADVLLAPLMATVEGTSVLTLRLIDPVTAAGRSVEKHAEPKNGEEIFAMLGPAVAELFPDKPMRAGVERGVPKEVGLLLNPPPLPPAVVIAGGSLAVATALVGAAAGLMTGALNDDVDAQLKASRTAPTAAAGITQEVALADRTALAANAMFISTAALAVATGVAALFTDFSGRRDADLDAL